MVNHHQHCYSGYEVYKGKPIFYGLGNFCFDNPKHHEGIWTEGYAITIDFSFGDPSFVLHPYYQCQGDPRITLLSQDAFSETIETLNAIISNSNELKSKVDDYYATSSPSLSNAFEPFYNRYYLFAKQKGWLPSFISKTRKLILNDFISCEAHRDKLIYWLNNT